MHADIDDFDPSSPRFPDQFNEIIDDVLVRCPVARSEALGGFWMVSKYEDIAGVARDWRHFSSAGLGTMIPPLGASVPALPASSDPPDHTEYRRILQPFFTPAAVARYEPALRTYCRELIARFADRESAELIAEYAEPIPSTALALLFGLEHEDWGTLRTLTRDMLATRFADPSKAAAAMDRFEQYIRSLITSRTNAPRDDVPTAIIHGTLRGQPLPAEIVQGIIFTVIAAGHETVVNGIGNMLHHIASIEGLQFELRADPSLIPTAVEESLRLASPTQWLGRTATCSVRIGDTEISPGDRVMLAWSAANRDPEAFADPSTFDASRNPNKQLAFGFGLHRCIGEHLARLEMRIAAEELLARGPWLRLAKGAPPTWKHNTHARGLERLSVEFVAGPVRSMGGAA